MEKISIIVPIYNVEKYIKKCISSLINQTYQNIEILAISDGSPDNSMNIVQEYAKRDQRIKCITKENGGYGSVLEYAIKKIRSAYFIICDPDDWLEPNAIEQLYNQAKKYKADLVIGERYLVYNDNMAKQPDRGYMDYYKIEPNKIYCDLTDFIFFSVTPHAKLYKTSLAKDIKFPHKVSYTDTILYLTFLDKANSAVYIDKPLANYFIDRPGNTNTDLDSLSQKAFNNMITVLNSLCDQICKDGKYTYALNYRIYTLCLFVAKKISSGEDKKQFINNKKSLLNIINRIKKYKKGMKKYIRAESKPKKMLKKVLLDLYFNNLTNMFAINLTIKYFKE